MREILSVKAIDDRFNFITNDRYMSNVEKAKNMIMLQEEAARTSLMGAEQERNNARILSEKIRYKWFVSLICKMNEDEKRSMDKFIKDFVHVA